MPMSNRKQDKLNRALRGLNQGYFAHKVGRNLVIMQNVTYPPREVFRIPENRASWKRIYEKVLLVAN